MPKPPDLQTEKASPRSVLDHMGELSLSSAPPALATGGLPVANAVPVPVAAPHLAPPQPFFYVPTGGGGYPTSPGGGYYAVDYSGGFYGPGPHGQQAMPGGGGLPYALVPGSPPLGYGGLGSPYVPWDEYAATAYGAGEEA